jgi:hypothetical protein
LSVDADEWIPPDLAAEIVDVLRHRAGDVDAFLMRFKLIFMGRWIKQSSIYPTWLPRLFRHRVIRYEKRRVNAHPPIAPERAARLQAHFIHDDRDGMGAFLARLPEFARLEAGEYRRVQEGLGAAMPSIRDVWGSATARRRWMKLLFMRMPFRPFLVFVYVFFVRRGFLDGYAGFVFAMCKAIQEWFVNLHLREMRLGVESTPASPETLPSQSLRKVG